MPLTLAEWAQTETNKITKASILGLAQEGLIADIMPWRNIDDLSETGVRWDSVIEPEYVAINGSIPEGTASGKQLRWGVSQMLLHIDIPVALEKAKNSAVRQSVMQTKLALRGAAYVLNDKWINGDQASDPNSFDGYNKIVGNLGSDQTVGATELDIRPSASPTSATMQAFLDRLHTAMHRVEGHQPSHALANDDFLLAFESIMRREKIPGDNHDWREEKLRVDSPRMTQRTKSTTPAYVYRGIPFYDLGPKADQSTKIVGNTYTEGGSTATGTRIFLVKLGDEDVEGLQFDPLAVTDIGLLEGKDSRRKRLKWTHGPAVWGPRSLVKTQGVRAA